MAYIMLPDLQVGLFYVCPIVESFDKLFMRRLTVGCVIIYRITIIPNVLDKVVNCIECRVVQSWLTWLWVN